MLNKLRIFIEYLKRPMPLNDFKDYDDYWDKRGFNEPSKHRAEIISKFIEPNSTILDIGCGDGTLIDFIAKNNSPIKIVGVDISKKAVEYTIKRGYEAYEMNILSDEFIHFINNNVFDYIIITEVIEHIQDSKKLMLNLKESFIKSIFVSIPNSGFIMHRLRLLIGYFPVIVIVHHIKEHIRFWTYNDFLYWCNYLGFEVVNYRVSSTSIVGSIDFGKLYPSLFAKQIIYEIQNHKKS